MNAHANSCRAAGGSPGVDALVERLTGDPGSNDYGTMFARELFKSIVLLETGIAPTAAACASIDSRSSDSPNAPLLRQLVIKMLRAKPEAQIAMRIRDTCGEPGALKPFSEDRITVIYAVAQVSAKGVYTHKGWQRCEFEVRGEAEAFATACRLVSCRGILVIDPEQAAMWNSQIQELDANPGADGNV